MYKCNFYSIKKAITGISIGVLFTLGGIFIITGIIWYIADIHIYIFSKKKSEPVNVALRHT